MGLFGDVHQIGLTLAGILDELKTSNAGRKETNDILSDLAKSVKKLADASVGDPVVGIGLEHGTPTTH